MIRIMIVEDEPPINRLLQTLIESHGEDYRIVSSVYNGQEALDVIEEVQPDVVFTDIKMPRMDGLQLTKALRSLCPDTLVVVITGYGDYENMRAMLQQNVYDYLLKPIQAATLQDLLRRLDLICQEQQRQRMTRGFYQAISRKGNTDALPELPYSCLIPGIACAGAFPASLPHSYILEKDYWIGSTPLRHLSHCDLWQLPGKTNAEQLLVLGVSTKDPEVIRGLYKQVFDMLPQKLPLTVLFGRPVTTVADAGIALDLLRNILPLHIRIGEHTLQPFCDIQRDPHIPDLSLDREQQEMIEFCVRQDNFSGFSAIMADVFSRFCHDRPNQYCVTRELKYLVQSLESHISDKTCHDRYYADLLVDEAILNAFDYTALQHNYLCICEDIFKIIARSRKQSTGLRDLVSEITAYIEENYDQPISGKSLEEHFLFSSSYINQLFKKQRGLSPNKYLLQYRAKKACEMISCDPEITAKVLAEQLGISDPLYLYKFFKNETGYTLSEYKNLVRQKLI